MIVIVIGPSGVGKTYLSDLAAKRLKLIHIDFDEIFNYEGIKIPWLQFKENLDKTPRKDNQIIDIGAGFYKYKELPSYIQKLDIPIILIYCDPKISVSRTPWGKDRKLDEYIDTDHTKNKELFDVANTKLDITGMDKENALLSYIGLLASIKQHRN